MQEAYKASCKKFGFQFHAEWKSNFTDVKNPVCLCTKYEDRSIPEGVVDVLEENDYDFEEINFFREEESFEDVDQLVNLLIWFIGQSREGFVAKRTTNENPVFNGYWTDNDMNVGIGYGMYW